MAARQALKITAVEVYALRGPEVARPHWTAYFPVPTGNELLVKLHTSDPSLEPGIGLATSYTDIAPLLKPFQSAYNLADHYILGRDPLRPEAINQDIFGLTSKKVQILAPFLSLPSFLITRLASTPQRQAFDSRPSKAHKNTKTCTSLALSGL